MAITVINIGINKFFLARFIINKTKESNTVNRIAIVNEDFIKTNENPTKSTSVVNFLFGKFMDKYRDKMITATNP